MFGVLKSSLAVTPELPFGEDQGFLTNTGRYVGREGVMVIARRAGQLLKVPTFQPDALFSEDVW